MDRSDAAGDFAAAGELGTPAGRGVVKQLLKKHGFVKRKARKKVAMGPRHPDSNAQFENIARLKQEYMAAGQPVLSIDTKKKELLGNFYRDGKLYTQEAVKVFDHDFPSAATGVVLPHGLYDFKLNRAHINLGTSHETSEFACDSLGRWWQQHGRQQYPQAKPAPAAVRRRRQQQREPLRVQGGVAGVGGSTGAGDSRGPLPAVLFQVQPHRAPPVPACDPRLPGRGVSHDPDRQGVDGKDQDPHGVGGDGGHHGQGLRSGPQGRQGFQGEHEDRLRQCSTEVELPGDPD